LIDEHLHDPNDEVLLQMPAHFFEKIEHAVN
jgi:hypothetical protein